MRISDWSSDVCSSDLVFIGIMLFLNRTIVGKAIRAAIEDVEHVEGLGINVSRLFTIPFVLAGALSGLAGGLHAPLVLVDPSMGIAVLAFAFRSAERRVWKECVSTCRSGWSP